MSSLYKILMCFYYSLYVLHIESLQSKIRWMQYMKVLEHTSLLNEYALYFLRLLTVNALPKMNDGTTLYVPSNLPYPWLLSRPSRHQVIVGDDWKGLHIWKGGKVGASHLPLSRLFLTPASIENDNFHANTYWTTWNARGAEPFHHRFTGWKWEKEGHHSRAEKGEWALQICLLLASSHIYEKRAWCWVFRHNWDIFLSSIAYILQ